MNDQERIITSVGTLFRALSHLIRGDLSVISNDLSFLSTLVPEGEVERAKNRCASIISTLHSLQFLKEAKFQPVETSVHALFTGISSRIQMPYQDDRSVWIDPELTRSVISQLISILLYETADPLQLSRINQDGSDDAYLIAPQLVNGDASPALQTIDLISGASQLRGESMVPNIALCELVMVTQRVECQLIFSQTTKNAVGLRFDFSRTQTTY